MINVIELRIGNWINFRRKPGKVYHLVRLETENRTEIYINESGKYQMGILDDLTPIPLSPEILVKCGFEKFETDYEHPKLYSVCYFEHEKMIVEFSEFRIEKRYLHELQNLFFDLTGEELNVQF